MPLKPLTLREEKFVDALFMNNFNGADAARIAGFSKTGAKVQAVRLLTKANLRAEIEARKLQLREATGITCDEWMKKVRRLFDADVRKLLDEHNNPIDIPLLGDNEALIIKGFDVVEDFTKVKKNKDGTEQAVCTGYTKKVRLTEPKEILAFVGKVMGYIREDQEPDPDDKAKRSLRVTFVSPKGKQIQVSIGQDGQRRLVQVNEQPKGEPLPPEAPASIAKRLGVRFVKPA
jgi:phage terminase small subunit